MSLKVAPPLPLSVCHWLVCGVEPVTTAVKVTGVPIYTGFAPELAGDILTDWTTGAEGGPETRCTRKVASLPAEVPKLIVPPPAGFNPNSPLNNASPNAFPLCPHPLP